MGEKKGSYLPGVILVMIGLWLLMRRYFPFPEHWNRTYPLLLIIFAIFLIFETFRRHQSGTIFLGIFVIIVGLFYLLRNYGGIPFFYLDEYWPLFLLAFGVGFLSIFIFNPKDWGVLIPAALFLFFGIGFSLQTFQGVFYGWELLFETYWPAVIILIGLTVFLRGLHTRVK